MSQNFSLGEPWKFVKPSATNNYAFTQADMTTLNQMYTVSIQTDPRRSPFQAYEKLMGLLRQMYLDGRLDGLLELKLAIVECDAEQLDGGSLESERFSVMRLTELLEDLEDRGP